MKENRSKSIKHNHSMRETAELLDKPEGLTAFCDAIIRERGVIKACKALGLDRSIVWLYLAKHPEAQAAVWGARQETSHALYDECIQIADDSSLDPRDRHIKIETRMRVAGKLNQRAYGDQPRHLSQTYVAGNVEIKADENTRQALILARQSYLVQRSPDTARHSLPAPSLSPVSVAAEPIKQPGEASNSTTASDDPHIIHMRSFEKDRSEDEH
jgi:hypothetical protein